MILPRVLTAVVLAPLFLWGLYLGSLPFFVFMGLLVFLALWEFHRMAEVGGHPTQGWVGIAGAVMVLLSLIFPGVKTFLPFESQSVAFAMMAVVLLVVLRELCRQDKSLSVVRLSMTAFSLFFIVWPLGYFILLRDLSFLNPALFNAGREAAFFMVVVIWAQDTAALAVGSAFGKHKLAPVVSPGKSWEGAVGGLVVAMVVGLVARELAMKDLFGRLECVVLAGAVGVLAQLSDLFESQIKRCFGVKDSSHLLPGHGGLLDRFDSFLLSSPFLYFYVLMVKGR